MIIPGKYIKAILLFAPKKDIRYYLNGVNFEVTDSQVIMAATTGAMLCSIRVTVEPGQVPGNYTIPYGVLTGITAKTNVDVIFTDTSVCLIQDGKGVTSQLLLLLDGVFPDWRKVIPDSTSGESPQLSIELLEVARKAKRILSGNGDIYIHHNGSDAAILEMGDPNVLALISPMVFVGSTYIQPEWTK